MRTASEAEVRDHLDDYLSEPGRGPLVITRGGAPAGILIPFAPGEDLDALIFGLSPRLRRILEASHAQIEAREHLSEDEFWAEVGAHRG